MVAAVDASATASVIAAAAAADAAVLLNVFGLQLSVDTFCKL